MLIDRIYPALSKHEIGTSEDRELVVRWQSEIEGAAKELDRILEEQKKRDAEGPHCDETTAVAVAPRTASRPVILSKLGRGPETRRILSVHRGQTCEADSKS